jgi:hypothetical protein
MLLAAAPAAQGQPGPAGSFELCLAAAADGSCVYPTRVFRAPTTAVVVAYPLRAGELQQLTARLTVLDVGGAIPANSVISQQDMRPAKNDTRGLVTFMGPPLPVGKYRVDVAADGKPWKPVEFTIVAADKPHAIKRPDDLLPLAAKKVWTYTLAQAGKTAAGGPTASIGKKIELMAPAAGGKGERTVTLTATGTDQTGTQIEAGHQGAPLFNEWWRVDERGWTVTQRKGPMGVAKVNPPQVLLPLPLTAGQEWSYDPFQQKYRMWGPLPVKGPQGQASGYVILIEQPQDSATETVEWHFVPGVGVVREVTITAAGAETISRTELILQSVR